MFDTDTKIGFAFIDVKTSWNKLTKEQKEKVVEISDFIDYNFAFGNEEEIVELCKKHNRELRGHSWFGIQDKSGKSIVDENYVINHAIKCANWCNKYNLSVWGLNAESGLWRWTISIFGKKTANPRAKEFLKLFVQEFRKRTKTKLAYLGYVDPNYYYPKDPNGKITLDIVELFDIVCPMIYQHDSATLTNKIEKAEELWPGKPLNFFVGPGRISDGAVVGNDEFWMEKVVYDDIYELTFYVGNEQKNNTNLDDPYWMIFNGHSRHQSLYSFIQEAKEALEAKEYSGF